MLDDCLEDKDSGNAKVLIPGDFNTKLEESVTSQTLIRQRKFVLDISWETVDSYVAV